MFTPVRLLAILVCLAAVHAQAKTPIPVMAGTSLIEDILAGLAGPRLKVKTVIPAAACPGHYDVKTSDVTFLSQAKIILLHDWQERMPTLVSIIEAVPGSKDKVVVIQVQGNWMAPDKQTKATAAILGVLEGLDPANAGWYRANARNRIERAAALGSMVRDRIRQAGLEGAPVICGAMQRPFVESLGLNVVADYGRFEEMGPEALAKTMTAAKTARVKLVLDNLQSTGAAGKSLADDLGAGHATLSNFPGGLPDTDTWEATVTKNVDLILAAAGR